MATGSKGPKAATASRLVEATTRGGMVALCVYVPRSTHRALLRLRTTDRLATGEAVRQALSMWLAKRRKGERS